MHILRKAHKATATICKDVDEIRCIIACATFNLYHSRLKKIEEVESLKAAWAKYEIIYHESVGDVGPYTSISNLFMS